MSQLEKGKIEQRRFQIRMPWRTTFVVVAWFVFCWNYRFDGPTKEFLANLAGKLIGLILPR